MSNYKYQHSIYFQYTYGSGALLIYLALVNFRDIKNASGRKRKGRAGYDGRLPATVCTWGLLCGLVLMGGVMYNKSKYAILYHRHYEEAAQARTCLLYTSRRKKPGADSFLICFHLACVHV